MKKQELKLENKKLTLNKVTISKLDAKKVKGGLAAPPPLTNSSTYCLSIDCFSVHC